MQRSIQVTTVQMDVRPAPTNERLFRADQMICDAVELGAELVVLPEMFSTGYTYSEDNFRRAEKMDGPTVTWMKRTARRSGIHLAGTLLLREDDAIYNAMLIAAPDGQIWRYDKSYPWGWERGYFRENPRQSAARAVVAQTSLGDLGMLVCWDIAHPSLWAAYAGQVDLMVICSSPPEVSNPTFRLAKDIQLGADKLGAQWAAIKEDGQRVFSEMVAEQTAWLGVPAVQSGACGTFESQVPNGRASLLGLIPGAPGLTRYLPQANDMHITTQMIETGQIFSAEGKQITRRTLGRGEGFISAEVTLANSKTAPQAAQPPARASRQAYFFSDTYLPRIMTSTYKRGLRNHR